jgi:prevent-host-death family protein
MTVQINIHEAKTHLSRLLTQVEDGEEIVIARAGTPIARLVPFASPAQPRQPGSAVGQIQMADDFDAPLPEEIIAAFEGQPAAEDTP